MNNLIDAIIAKDISTVRQLLESGVNANACEDKDKITPLHFAAQYDARECALILIAGGARLDAQTVEGLTPLAIAKLNGHMDMVKLLADIQSTQPVEQF